MKMYCYWTSWYVSFIWLPSFESFSARWIWISVHLIYGDPPWFVCLVHSLPSNIFCWVGTPGDRAKLVLNLHSWKTIYLKIIVLFLSSFWCTTFLFLSLRCNISSGGEKIIRFLLFWIRFTCVFRRGLRGKNRRNPFEEKLFLTCYSCSWRLRNRSE